MKAYTRSKYHSRPFLQHSLGKTTWKCTKYFRKYSVLKGYNKDRCRPSRLMEMPDVVQVTPLVADMHPPTPWPLESPHCYTSETSFLADPSLQSQPHCCQKLLVSNEFSEARSCPKKSELLMTVHKVTPNSKSKCLKKARAV